MSKSCEWPWRHPYVSIPSCNYVCHRGHQKVLYVLGLGLLFMIMMIVMMFDDYGNDGCDD
mgnify:CR=1 FL=1